MEGRSTDACEYVGRDHSRGLGLASETDRVQCGVEPQIRLDLSFFLLQVQLVHIQCSPLVSYTTDLTVMICRSL